MATRSEMARLSGKSRAEIGVAGGFVASVVMGVSVIVVTSINFLKAPWFTMVGSIFGASGNATNVAISGLIWFLAIGIVGGLIFAFGFTYYSVNKGLGFAVIGLIFTAIILSSETVSPLSGTLGQIGLGSSLELFVPLAVCYIVWGFVMGIVARRYSK